MILALVAVLAARAAPPAEQLVGTWNVTMTVDYSTCESAVAGDIRAQQWVISVSSGKLSVDVLASGRTTDKYLGAVLEGRIGLQRQSSAQYTTVELDGDATQLTGRRVVAKSDPCAIIYTVDAKRM